MPNEQIRSPGDGIKNLGEKRSQGSGHSRRTFLRESLAAIALGSESAFRLRFPQPPTPESLSRLTSELEQRLFRDLETKQGILWLRTEMINGDPLKLFGRKSKDVKLANGDVVTIESGQESLLTA